MTEQPPDLVRNPQPSSGPDEPAPRPPVPLKRVKRTALFTLALLALIAGVFAATITFKLGEKLEPKPSDIGGPFWLVSTAGKTTTERDLLGHWSLIYFGYTYCPDVCPTTLADLTQWMGELGADASKLKVYFITVDPARDTRAAMASYMQAFDPHFIALTGTQAQIDQVTKDYRIYSRKVPGKDGNYTMDHTATVFLLDSKAELVSTIDYQEKPDQAVAKLKRLIAGS